MSLKLYEEPVTPTGGHKSEGVQNVLGRPPMNWITVVLREAVQNSWDARQGESLVDFEIRWWRPTREQKNALRDQVFTNEPAGSPIRREFSKQDFDVMVFSDRGTKGLTGPVFANEPSEPGEKRNFVDFVWEIGRSEGVGPGGGTYGYGKTSFFRLSRVRAICIHSRCQWRGQPEHRLIAAYLGPSTPQRTGRAWWGDLSEGGVRPLSGTNAEELAEAIGMPPFAPSDCGTSIMVLAPRVEDLTCDDENTGGRPGHQQVLSTLAESLVQWFWPKMVELNGRQSEIRFRIVHDGLEFALPRVEDVPPFNVYAEALRLMVGWKSGKALPNHATGVVIQCGRPVAQLGHLVMVKRSRKNRDAQSGEFGEASVRELFAQSHHVVLLRKPRLVVKYLRGSRPPSDQVDYAGVFIVDDFSLHGKVEEAFALSEPPTHDDWVPETLEDQHQKTFVRVGLRRIKEAFAEFAAPIAVSGGAETQDALGAFSEMLGGLLAGSADGTGPRVQPPSAPGRRGGGGAAAKKSRVEIDGAPCIQNVDGIRCLAVPFRVALEKGVREIRVRAKPIVLLEQGAEKDPPRDAAQPRVISFSRMRNNREESAIGTGSELTVTADKANDRWMVRVSLPAEARVRVELSVI